MDHTPLFWKVVFLGVAAGALWFVSLYVARYTTCTDFPVFYAAAKSIIGENGTTHSLYDPDLTMKYRIPEPLSGGRFIYSKSVAYLLLPLGFLPYYPAKATMIFANILAYLWGLGLVLKILGAHGRWFVYPLGLAILFTPFLQSIRFAQTNGFVLFLIAASAWLATKQKNYLSGFLLAGAMLFKLFPAVILLLVGLRNRFICLSATLVFCLNFLIPDSLDWFGAIPAIQAHFTSVLWGGLTAFGLEYALAYFSLVLLCSGYLISRNDDMLFQYSYAITCMFMVLPVFSYAHLTFWIIPVVFGFWRFRTWGYLVPLVGALILIVTSSVETLTLVQHVVCLTVWLLFSVYAMKHRCCMSVPPGVSDTLSEIVAEA